MKRNAMTALLLVLIGFSFKLFAAAPSFQEANQLYATGKYQEAITAYKQLAESKPLAEIYYNLGNAYFKDKQFGNAILSYERARRLSPRDRDILSNLAFVNRLIEYKIEDKRNWLSRTSAQLVSFLRLEECWLLFLVSYSIFITALLIALLKRRPLLGQINHLLLWMVIFSSLPALLKLQATGMGNEAVVTAKQAEVRYGPSTVDRIAFRLVEGLKVSIHDHKQDWYRIRLRDSRSGWVRESEMSII